MRLREALDLCTLRHLDDWVRIPGERPATAMVAAMFDPGVADDPRTRPLVGHSLAVYDSDPRLSLVWLVPEDDDHVGARRESWVPEWAEQETFEWKNARSGFAVVLLGGAPIWQERLLYLDWGSGVGGYVADFSPRFGDYDEAVGGGVRRIDGWEASAWSVGLAGLINSFSTIAREFANVDPTARVVPSPSTVHPVDAERSR